jgi:hypothetical protein
MVNHSFFLFYFILVIFAIKICYIQTADFKPQKVDLRSIVLEMDGIRYFQ